MRATLIILALLFPFSAYAGLNNGLVGYWPLDKRDTPWTSATAATTKDRSSNSNTGTLTNMSQATSPVIGKIGQALKFDGVDDYVNTGITSNTNFSNTTFSVSAWFKTTSSATQMLVAKQSISGSSGGWAVSLSGTVLSVVHKDGAGGNVLSRITSSSGLNDGRWHHVVFTMTTNTSSSSGQNIDIYLDGVLNQGSLTNTAASATIANAVYIGNRFATSFPWSGSIDEVRIYNRALSAGEVKDIYRQGIDNSFGSWYTSLLSAFSI